MAAGGKKDRIEVKERRKPENKGGRKVESKVSGERNHEEGV